MQWKLISYYHKILQNDSTAEREVLGNWDLNLKHRSLYHFNLTRKCFNISKDSSTWASSHAKERDPAISRWVQFTKWRTLWPPLSEKKGKTHGEEVARRETLLSWTWKTFYAAFRENNKGSSKRASRIHDCFLARVGSQQKKPRR